MKPPPSNRVLFEFLHHATKSIQLYIDEAIDLKQLFDTCERILESRVSIDLFIAPQVAQKIEEQPFVLGAMYKFRTRGGSVYSDFDAPLNLSVICQIDFKQTLVFGVEDGSSVPTFQEFAEDTVHRDFFDHVIHATAEFRLEPDDILLWAKVDSPRVFEQATTELRWESANANQLEIVGKGEAKLSGQTMVQVFSDTVITLIASNEQQIKIRSLAIASIQKLEINYTLQFFNPASKAFENLKREDNSSVFGVIKDARLRLVWNLETAETVDISPFQISESKGSHEFSIDDQIKIIIRSRLQGKTVEEKIIIRGFPVPVFTSQFIEIEDSFLKGAKVAVKDLRYEANQYLEEKGVLNSNLVDELRVKSLSDGNALMRISERESFADFYRERSIPRLNQSIKQRLRHYFKEKPTVIAMIKSIRNYYE